MTSSLSKFAQASPRFTTSMVLLRNLTPSKEVGPFFFSDVVVQFPDVRQVVLQSGDCCLEFHWRGHVGSLQHHRLGGSIDIDGPQEILRVAVA